MAALSAALVGNRRQRRRLQAIPIETRSLPALARSYPRHFTFYVANPISSIASRPHCKHLPRMTPGFGAGLVIPDLWQQEAVRALQGGRDVVVQAPTGSGKTYIFELLYPALKGQRSEEHTSELQSRSDLVCRLLLEKKKNNSARSPPHHILVL